MTTYYRWGGKYLRRAAYGGKYATSAQCCCSPPCSACCDTMPGDVTGTLQICGNSYQITFRHRWEQLTGGGGEVYQTHYYEFEDVLPCGDRVGISFGCQRSSDPGTGVWSSWNWSYANWTPIGISSSTPETLLTVDCGPPFTVDMVLRWTPWNSVCCGTQETREDSMHLEWDGSNPTTDCAST